MPVPVSWISPSPFTSTAAPALRSYVACCMLAGMGFDCYNLSGGWRLYESILSETKSPEHGCYDPN